MTIETHGRAFRQRRWEWCRFGNECVGRHMLMPKGDVRLAALALFAELMMILFEYCEPDAEGRRRTPVGRTL